MSATELVKGLVSNVLDCEEEEQQVFVLYIARRFQRVNLLDWTVH